MSLKSLLAAAVAVSALGASGALACEVDVGLVLELTGPAGVYGQAGAKAVTMAFDDMNAAGGVTTDSGTDCKIVPLLRDSQSQSTVAVDQATQLVNVSHVPVVIGGIISSVTLPILTSVTAPAKVVQVSPAASSPTLTTLGQDGKTGGYFFRTITSDALQGTAAAKYAVDQGMKKLAIVYVNNDFGLNMMREFQKAYESLGGTITSATPYNEKQASYSSEATAAMKGDPQALYLISTPVDGATIARAWISNGGPQKFLLNDGMNSEDFIKAVGKKYLNGAYGTSSGTDETASTKYFYDSFAKVSGGIAPDAPAADRSYDAGAIVALAIAEAKSTDPAKIRDAIHAVTAPGGTPIHAGPEEFKKALALIADGKPVKYEGVIGPVSFDQYGDITGPFRLWKIADGKVETTGTISADEVSTLKASLK